MTAIRPTFNKTIFFTPFDAETESTSPSATLATPAEPPMTYAPSKHGTIEEFLKHKDFSAFQEEYEALIDRLLGFAKNNQGNIAPPLSDDTLKKLDIAGATLKFHMFPKVGSYDLFSKHKALIFGEVKQNFHELDRLLNDGKFSLRIRLDTLI